MHDWPSSDSDDSDYNPERSPADGDVTTVTHKAKCRKIIKANDDKVDIIW